MTACICGDGSGHLIINGFAIVCPSCAEKKELERLQLLSHAPRSAARFDRFSDLYAEVKSKASGHPEALKQFNQLVNALTKFAHNPHGWHLVCAQPGTYKSTLLAQVLKVQSRAVYAYIPDLTDAIFQTVRREEDDDNMELDELKRAYGTAPVLLLDDLGAEHQNGRSDFIKAQLTHLVDMRYRDRLPTVITSNFSPETILSRYDRLGSRLLDRNLTTIWTITLPDLRR